MTDRKPLRRPAPTAPGPAAALAAALATLTLAAAPARADVPAWLGGAWATSARLTAPDGAQIRIRCTLDADTGTATGTGPAAGAWTGTLGCATVQGRFAGDWRIVVSGSTAEGSVAFSGGPAGAAGETQALAGTVGPEALTLATPDGQGVAFRPGADGAVIVAMDRLGPQRLTGELTFEPR